jgi:hypothetical protein
VSTGLQLDPSIIEKALIGGDLSGLSGEQKLSYYKRTCESLGLNPLTKPFQYIVLNEKLTLYATKDCTEQLRTIHGISLTIAAREVHNDVYVVTARATRADGRTDEATGAVPLVKEDGEWTTSSSGKRYFKKTGTLIALSPDERANAIMKAETKAKRRVTLSICGLGILDESETETIRGAVLMPDIDTGPAQIGTQEAADHVAKEKIKKLEAKRDAELHVTEADMPEAKSKDYAMLKAFGVQKKRIGDGAYYGMLNVYGYQHANEISDTETARRLYKELQGLPNAEEENDGPKGK